MPSPFRKPTVPPSPAQTVTTTAGAPFSAADHEVLASLIWRRWGCDTPSAACAWRRLFQNDCTDSDFLLMARAGVVRSGS